MCQICDDWVEGIITTKKALELFGKGIDKAKKRSDTDHLYELMDTILDKEVPVAPVDKEAERFFWEQTHRGEDED